MPHAPTVRVLTVVELYAPPQLVHKTSRHRGQMDPAPPGVGKNANIPVFSGLSEFLKHWRNDATNILAIRETEGVTRPKFIY